MADETISTKDIRDSMGLSKKLQVIPSKTNTIFKLMSKKNGGTNRVPWSSFEGKEVIYDEGQEDPWKRDVTLRYVKSRSSRVNEKGETIIQEDLGTIDFDSSGVLIVKPSEYSKLVYLRRSNSNDSNPFRDKGVVAKWYEEEPGKSKTELLNKEIRISDCSKIIAGMSPKELQVGCKKFGYDYNADIDDMKYSLILQAKKDPDFFINEVGSRDDKTNLLIENAISQQFIEMDLTNNQWIWSEDKELITTFAPDKIEKDSLFDFLTSMKGKEALNKLKKIV